MTDNLWLWNGSNAFAPLMPALGFLLSFIGLEMMLAHSPWKIGTHTTPGMMVVLFTVPAVASLVWSKQPVKLELPRA